MKKSINLVINGANLNIKCEEEDEQDIIEAGYLLNKVINSYEESGKLNNALKLAALEITLKTVKAINALEEFKATIKE